MTKPKKLIYVVSLVLLFTLANFFSSYTWAKADNSDATIKEQIRFNDGEIENLNIIDQHREILNNNLLKKVDDRDTVIDLITNLLIGKVQMQNLYKDVHFKEIFLFDADNKKHDDSLEFFINNAELFGKMRSAENIEITDNALVYTIDYINLEKDEVSVCISEEYSFQISGLENRSYVNTKYEFLLQREDDGLWAFKEISSNDWFEQAMHGHPFDVDAKLAEMTEEKPEKDRILVDNSEENQQDEGRPSTVVTIDYSVNPARVYNYARNFYDYYNSALYGNYNGSGGDCMNFASQCLAVGLGFSSDAISIANGYSPCDNVGSYRWYPHTTQFTNCSDFRTYLSNNNNETGLFGSVFESNSSTVTCSAGDVVFTVNDSGDPYGHAAVVISGGNNRSNIVVSAHNNDRIDVSMAWMCGSASSCMVCHPTNFKIYSNCTGHVYSSLPSANGTDSICNNCGYSRLRINATTLPLVTVGTTKSISGVVNLNCYRIAVGVKNPYGNTTWLSPYSSGYSYNYNYNFSIPGIYTITISARDKNPDISGSTAKSFVYQVRVTN